MKIIPFANYNRAAEVAENMNPNHIVLSDNETRGTTYYRWLFSEDATVLVYTHGEGKKGSRFQTYFLIRGTANKVGRDATNLDFYNEKIEVK